MKVCHKVLFLFRLLAVVVWCSGSESLMWGIWEILLVPRLVILASVLSSTHPNVTQCLCKLATSRHVSHTVFALWRCGSVARMGVEGHGAFLIGACVISCADVCISSCFRNSFLDTLAPLPSIFAESAGNKAWSESKPEASGERFVENRNLLALHGECVSSVGTKPVPVKEVPGACPRCSHRLRAVSGNVMRLLWWCLRGQGR